MRLAEGPLGAGWVHLLGILLAKGLPEDRTEPRAPKDISCPSTILFGHNCPGRCQMGGGGRGLQLWAKSAFHSQNITADAASLEGKGKCKGSWKTLFQSFGERLIFLFSIYLGRVGWCFFFFLKAAGKIRFAIELQRWPTALGRCWGSSKPSLAASLVPPQSSQLGSHRGTQRLLSHTSNQHLYERFPLKIWHTKLQTRQLGTS